MNKRNKIIYWVATIWLSLGMISTAIVQLIQMEEEVENFANLGYPTYVMTIVGIAKILGVVAILIPKFPLIKEWAYAGFAFTMIGATISHLAISDDWTTLIGPLLLLVLTFISWNFRPDSKKLIK